MWLDVIAAISLLAVFGIGTWVGYRFALARPGTDDNDDDDALSQEGAGLSAYDFWYWQSKPKDCDCSDDTPWRKY